MDGRTDGSVGRDFATLADVITKEKKDLGNGWKKLLAQSLFYYCSGDDVSPIYYQKLRFPVYVYVDMCCFDEFDTLFQNMTERLQKDGYKILRNRDFSSFKGNRSIKKIALTEWKKNNDSFCLLFIYADAEMGYDFLYGDGNKYIMPKCVCNFRYELWNSPFNCYNYGKGMMREMEKRVEYIMGHDANDKYEAVDTLPHLSNNEEITVYRRFYYYLY